MGTHGQAIQGKVILDISLLDGIEIEAPNQDGGYTSLKDMDFSKRASKSKEAREIPHNITHPLSREHLYNRFMSAKHGSTGKFTGNVGNKRFLIVLIIFFKLPLAWQALPIILKL